MTPFILYLLKTNGLLAVIFIFYYLFLRKDTFFVAIRYYFLLGITLSLLLPLLQLTKTVYIEQPLDWSRFLSPASNDAMIEKSQSFVERFDLMAKIPYVFGFLTAVISLLFSGRVLRLIRHVKRLPHWQSKSEIKIDATTNEAYSFWKWIVLPVNHQEVKALETIIQHEQIHVQQKHTVDLLVIHFLRRIFWFNPFLLLLEQAIRLNLEYIVDQKVTNQQNSYDYQLALVQFEQTKTTSFTLVNSFGASDLKKRIIMLNQPKSKTMRKSKFILCLPLAVGFFLLFQIKTQAEVRLVEEELEQTEQEPVKEQNQPRVNVHTLGTMVTDDHTTALAQKEEAGVPSEMGMKITDEDKTVQLMMTSGTGKMKIIKNGKEITAEELEQYKVTDKTAGKSHTYVIHSSGAQSGGSSSASFIINGKEYSLEDLEKLGEKSMITSTSYSYFLDNETLSEDVKRQIEEAKRALEDTKKVREEALKASRDALKASREALEASREEREKAIKNSKKALEDSRKAREEAKRDVLVITSGDRQIKTKVKDGNFTFESSHETTGSLLYIVDGKRIKPSELNTIKSEEIESVNVLKGKEGKEKYGKEGENGVIEINRKK
ncbi:M56 family metallopeptidase [Myroides sp. DW712]|uniref:M56 family metallopeptidase n=1 Tax=Myroides sp. DW712 TaxID=3389800 RepID=UPI00397BDC11